MSVILDRGHRRLRRDAFDGLVEAATMRGGRKNVALHDKAGGGELRSGDDSPTQASGSSSGGRIIGPISRHVFSSYREPSLRPCGRWSARRQSNERDDSRELGRRRVLRSP